MRKYAESTTKTGAISIYACLPFRYLFNWYFQQDGTIEYEIKLTGELSTNQLSKGESSDPTFGTLVMDGVNAQHHQHMFCARLDMAIDDHNGGAPLVVTEVCTFSPLSQSPGNTL